MKIVPCYPHLNKLFVFYSKYKYKGYYQRMDSILLEVSHKSLYADICKVLPECSKDVTLVTSSNTNLNVKAYPKKRVIIINRGVLDKNPTTAVITSILAHELGHIYEKEFRRTTILSVLRTISTMLLLLFYMSGVTTCFLSLLLASSTLFVLGLLLVASVPLFLIAIILLTRKLEWEADTYAVRREGSPEWLARSLLWLQAQLSLSTTRKKRPTLVHLIGKVTHLPVEVRVAKLYTIML